MINEKKSLNVFIIKIFFIILDEEKIVYRYILWYDYILIVYLCFSVSKIKW